MTYEDVNNVLNGTMIPGYEKFYDTLKQLEILSNILEKRKQNRQCINIFDNSVLTGIKQEQAYVKPLNKGKSQKILENCMLIFNETVAKYSFKSLLPFIYRCEEKPDAKKLEEIVLELKNLGYDFKVNRTFDDEYYLYDMLQQIEKYPEYPILSMKIIQGLKKAFYTPNNIGHFGLVLFFYTHFSAPIRRFPDLQNQILIKNYIKGQYPENIDKLNKELEEISEHCNFTSKLSDTLERYIDNKIIKIYMEQHSQDIFNVTICCITRNTITVKTDNGIYGKINVEDLNEIYKYNKDKKILYNDKEILKIGTKIDVILKKIEGYKIKFKSPTTSIVRVRK